MTMNNFGRINVSSFVRVVLGALAAIVLAAHGTGRLELHATSNPVATENANPGDTGWDISGSGDGTIQGFATSISVNTGETVDFKIATDAANYRIDIYRLGYYQGAGRKVATSDTNAPSVLTRPTFAVTLPQSQPACLTDLAVGLVDCGNWATSASWSSAGAVSGIYFAKLNRSDTGGSSQIFFIVRDDNRRADVIAQTSDTTWQAYNRYGGYSLYCAPAGVGLSNAGSEYANSCANRAAKVSYNRPFDTRDHDARSFIFNAEYPMVRWLEANGYDVKYWAGVDTDRRGADLVNTTLKPSVFVSMGHDEYWSGNQRTQIEAARGAGVNLAFFSGNEMFWKTRYEADTDGDGVPHAGDLQGDARLGEDRSDGGMDRQLA